MRSLIIVLMLASLSLAGCTEAFEDVKTKAEDAYHEYQQNQDAAGAGWSSKPAQSAGGDDTEDDLGNEVPSPEMEIAYDKESRTVTVTEFEFHREVPWVVHNVDDVPDDYHYMRISMTEGGCETTPQGMVTVGDTIVCDSGTKLGIGYYTTDDAKGGSVSMFHVIFDSDEEAYMDNAQLTWDRDQPGKLILTAIEWNGGDIVWAEPGTWDSESDRWAIEYRIQNGACTSVPSGVAGEGDSFSCDSGTSLMVSWRDAINDESDGQMLLMHNF